MTRPLRIGLTGPIGCGKSTVASWLGEAGGLVIDADAMARAATARGEPTLPLIHSRFGERVFEEDGSLDRAALGEIVFQHADALRDLESIVHPYVRERIEDAVAAADATGAPFVVVEAIKLVEAGLARECDEVWLVECSRSVQATRLSERGMAEDDATRRIAAQGDDIAHRLGAAATRRIVTEGLPAETRRAVEQALEEALRRRDR